MSKLEHKDAFSSAQCDSTAHGDTELQLDVYRQTLSLIERLHRQLLDMIKSDLDTAGHAGVNNVQALLLHNIGDCELTAGELRSRGHYLGSNVSYNLKKLVDAGYIHHQRSESDRRSVLVRLTPAGHAIRDLVSAMYERQCRLLNNFGKLNAGEFTSLNSILHSLEEFWGAQLNQPGQIG